VINTRRMLHLYLRPSPALLALLLCVGKAGAIEFTTDTLINSSQHAGEPIIVTGCTLTIDCSSGPASYSSLLVRGSGVVRPRWTGLTIGVGGNVTVEAGSRIDATGQGFVSRSGPGHGDFNAGNGATHGGCGGANGIWAYDSVTDPSEVGSGGGPNGNDGWLGGSGGGGIWLTVGGACTMDGTVSADGVGPANAGGGAGGTVSIRTATLAGSGSIRANGGTPDVSALPAGLVAGGGGGGRVAVVWDAGTFNGSMQARGGKGVQDASPVNGGPGTVYNRQTGAEHDSVTFDNGTWTGTTMHRSISLPTADLAIASATLLFDCAAGALIVHHMDLTNGATMTCPTNDGHGLQIVAGGNLTVSDGCAIDVSGTGFPNRSGSGRGDFNAGNGATHGGSGSGNTTWVYDSITSPSEYGSGGGPNNNDGWLGGHGGGLASIQVAGACTVDGAVRADGAGPANAGAGAGGSLNLSVGSLTGHGLISANGGTPDTSALPAGWAAGGGGGGRIALSYTTMAFAGSMQSRGGHGLRDGVAMVGGPGSIYIRKVDATTATLLFDNGPAAGPVRQPVFAMADTDMTVRGALMTLSAGGGGLSVRNLTVDAGTVMDTLQATANGLQITVVQDLTIGAEATLDVTGQGYVSRSGNGHGDFNAGNGATHGGSGAGNGYWAYDSITNPGDHGSGGGPNGNDGWLGGAGGGLVQLLVPGTLALAGAVHADGVGPLYAGGGAGGSVNIAAGTLSGDGIITADGGSPDLAGLPDGWSAGGGGGGRIALAFSTTSFTGRLSAKGGIGSVGASPADGGPGSIYTHQAGADTANLLFENGTHVGPVMQPVFSMVDTDVVVHGALMTLSAGVGGLSVRNLTVDAGSVFTSLQATSNGLQISTAQNLTVGPTSAFDVSGRGYSSRSGSGHGDFNAGNGATHGGSGAANSYWAYDSITDPSDHGSGGGSNSNDGWPGGTGGGRMLLQVAGTLQVVGLLAADGAGPANAGGGAGGSINITAGALSGSGTIRANGGSPITASLPAGWRAGGGGGGRIAMSYGTLTFGGTVQALGGQGLQDGVAQNGGPGSVYTRQSGAGFGSVTFDNGLYAGPVYQPAIDMPDADVVLRNALVTSSPDAGGSSFRSLLVDAGSKINCQATSGPGILIHVGQNCTIAAGGAIDVTGLGYGSRQGPGYGAYNTGSGAAHGGGGGGNGRATYGSLSWPNDFGSGGGPNQGDVILGSSGGGLVALTVLGTLTLNGGILADGAPASCSGAGSGGSVRIACQALTGTGVISARGGSTENAAHPELNAGGGGGGRIAIRQQPAPHFPGGTVTVSGGAGVNGWNGLDGTIYWGETWSQPDFALVQADAAFEWHADGTGTAHVTLTNNGLSASPATTVGAYTGVPGHAGTVALGAASAASLPSFGSIRLDVPVISGVRVTQLYLVADPGNAFAEGREDNNTVTVNVARTDTSVYAPDRTGVITTTTVLKAYLKRLTDNAWVEGRPVSFLITGVQVGSANTDAGGQAVCSWVISAGPASRTIRASFDGDATYNPSSGTATLTAQTVATKVYVVDRTAKVKSYVVLKAYLYLLNNTPVGGKLMTVKLDGSALGTDTTRPAGYVQLGYTVPEGVGAGTRTIRGEWAGDGGYTATANNGKLTVTKGDLYVWPYVRSGKRGTSHPLQAYVRSLPDYLIQPGKGITFSVNGTPIGTAASAADGWATTTWAIPAAEPTGAHTATAEFSGDAWYKPVTATASFNVVP
jgi:hypothetical protein